MSNDKPDDIKEQKQRDHVAAQLGIDPVTLDEYPYTLDISATAWRIYWDDEAPRGVPIEGNPGNSWSSIPPEHGDAADGRPERGD